MSESEHKSSCMDDFDPDSLAMEQARELILAELEVAQQTETLPLHACFGRILAQQIQATIDVPGFRNSAMDGYAFRHADSEHNAAMAIAGSSMAGHPFSGTVPCGHCIRVMTGALVPDELDTVVMQENVQLRNEQITIEQLPERGSNIRQAGSNIARDSILLKPYCRLGAVELGLLSSIGCQQVSVLRKLRVACFSTGDELIDSGQTPGPGMIHDSNRYMLLGLLQQPAIEAVDLGICRDRQSDLAALMTRCADMDVAISSGGVSVGAADYIRQILSTTGTIKLWKIAMKPGRPLTHARLDSGTQFFGLPGNPVSGMVTFHQFVLPAIEAMLGQRPRLEIQQYARLKSPLRKQAGRIELQRGMLWQQPDGQWWVETTGMQDSHVLTSMHRANCYIVLDMQSTGADSNEQVLTLPFSNYWHPM